MEIRKYQPRDKENCREICHKTASAPKYVNSKDLVCALYCDYYVENESDNCFVVTNQEGNAIGYILCAPNPKIYDEGIKPYLKKARELDFFESIGPWLECHFLKGICKKYPAHLHIDILPEGQGQGAGSKLIHALESHLKTLGVKGVRLGVGGDNKGAHRFYERNGFKLIRNFGAMGRIYAKSLIDRNKV